MEKIGELKLYLAECEGQFRILLQNDGKSEEVAQYRVKVQEVFNWVLKRRFFTSIIGELQYCSNLKTPFNLIRKILILGEA